jgi:hypothetical protein
VGVKRVATYTVDALDEVQIFDGVPGHSAGAPMPQILANDVGLVLAYELAPDGEQYAIVKFIRPRAHYFGSPSDETITGHPLWELGLRPYGVFEVRNSSWIRALERMNGVHPNHDPSRFTALRHFVFTFHDKTFECVANGAVLVAKFTNEVETIKDLPGLMASYLD